MRVLLSLMSFGAVFLSTENAFAGCHVYGGGFNGVFRAQCDITVQMYPTSGKYPSSGDNATEYDIVIMKGNSMFSGSKLSYRTGSKSTKFDAMKTGDKAFTYGYYVTRMSGEKKGDKIDWSPYGHPFCFSFNKASFRVDCKQTYNGKYDVNGYNGMGFFSGYLKYDPKPQKFLYYDKFTGKNKETEIDVILGGGTLPTFSCTTDVGNTANTDNRSRWQIWQPDPKKPGILYDSQYFFLYDVDEKETTCTRAPIQPRYQGGCRQWNDTADNCTIYTPCK